MNTNNRSQYDVVHHFAEVFKSLADYKRERKKQLTLLCLTCQNKRKNERFSSFLYLLPSLLTAL